MIASLPMYQRPELVGAHQRYWELIRRNLGDAGISSPGTLSQQADEFETWRDPALVLSQTCGMPYRNHLHAQVTLIGTPDFGIDGCDPGYYRSAFVVRADDKREHTEQFASAVFAYNQNHSQSGYAAAYHHVASLGFWFERRLHTGQHLESALAIAEGRADIASIDAVTLRLIQQHEPFADQLRVIDRTTPTPGLPYIAGPAANASATFDAIQAAIASLDAADRTALGLQGLALISADNYLQIANPPQEVTDAMR